MKLVKLTLRLLVQNVRFAHKSSNQGAKANSQKPATNFVYEDLAATVNKCQLEFSRFVFYVSI